MSIPEKDEPSNGNIRQEARISLLQYYSSNCTVHGTNILAITIGFFASIEILNLPILIDKSILLSILIAFFASLIFHQVVRLAFLALLSEMTLHVDFPEKIERNLIDSLNYEVGAFLSGKMKEKDKQYWRTRTKTFSLLHRYKHWLMILIWFVCFFLSLLVFQ
jgi:hypothetical protein